MSTVFVGRRSIMFTRFQTKPVLINCTNYTWRYVLFFLR